MATLVNVRSLDPALAYEEAWRSISELVFARLVTWDAQGAIVPDLAREVIPAPDGASYTFELRPGLRFHDGAPLLARDVKRSLERLLHPKTPSPGASLYTKILGRRPSTTARLRRSRGCGCSAICGWRSISTAPTRPSSPR